MQRFWFLCLSFFVVMFLCVYSVQAQSNVAVGKMYTLTPNSGEGSYADTGGQLTDDIYLVTADQWDPVVGFLNTDPVITVDLGSSQYINNAELYYFYSNGGAGIVMPLSVAFSYSVDGSTYTELGSTSSFASVDITTYKMSLGFSVVNARYLRFSVTHGGEWTFLSEVKVYSTTEPVPTQLVFVQQPTDIVAGSVITPMITVQLKESSGNNASVSGIAVDMSLSSGTGVLSGITQQLTDASGLASFSDLSIDTAGSKVLTASSTGLTSALSNAFNVSSQPTPTPPVPTPTPTPTINLTPSMAGVIYGRVLDKFLSQLPEVKVEYSSTGNEYLGKNPVFTDVDGYYYFEDCDTGFNFDLIMSMKRYGTITESYNGTASSSVLRLPDEVLVRGNSDKFKLSGVVKNVYGTPVDFVRVRAKSGGVAHVGFTDLSGRYSFTDLSVGTYTVMARRDGYYNSKVKYANTLGLDDTLDMVIQEK